MTNALLCLLLSAAPSGVLDEPAVQLKYSGSLVPVGRESSGDAVKTFSVLYLVTKSDNGREITFLVNERGGGPGFPWAERFGRLNLDGEHNPQGALRARLLHDHDGTKYPLPLRLPVFEFTDRLEEGAEWNSGKLAYEVGRKKKVGDRQCWEVHVSTNFGRRKTLYVEVGTPLVVEAEERVFMGQGDQFVLKMELEDAQAVDKAALKKLEAPLETLAELKEKLERRENETRPELTKPQLKLAEAAALILKDTAADTPFDRFSTDIRRDVERQLKRYDTIDVIVERFVDKPAPEFELTGIDGKTVDPAEYDGKIVLLHFWHYPGERLEEPYGQIGYLDFLNNKRKKLGVQVYGVAVDPRLKDPKAASAAKRSIRKCREFMNLGYTLTVDDGTLLKKFGDPTSAGAELPLWVVVSPDGKIVKYDVGYYNIKPDKGLTELDAVVVEQIRKKAGKD